MPKLRYGVAMSLDGYIAGPNGESDWIVKDPEVNFEEMWAQFDTFIMGRLTYETAASASWFKTALRGMKVAVVSRTLRPADHDWVEIIPELTAQRIQALRAQSKKDIWLFGGGRLFQSLLEMREVDGIDVAVMPVMLGGGIAVLPAPAARVKLKLVKQKIYSSGIVSLSYEVKYS